MRHLRRIFILLAFLLLPAGWAWGAPIQVAVSIPPQAYFARQVGGERVHVVVLLPPGANPATFEPKAGTLIALSKARLFFRIHVPFENAWMDKFRAVNRKMVVVDTTKGIRLSGNDPHIWLAPELVARQIKIIHDALETVDPAGKEMYERNYSRFRKRLKGLEKQIRTRLASVHRRVFLAYHPCWGYFAREFGLRQLTIEREGKAPGARSLTKIIQTARKYQLRCVFAQSQFDTRSARMIARQIGGKVVLIDPLSEAWDKNLLKVAAEIADCLRR